MKYFQKILNVAISVFIFIGIPYFCGWAYVFVTWITAVLVFSYLDEEISQRKIKNSFNFFSNERGGGSVPGVVYVPENFRMCAGGCGEKIYTKQKLEDSEILYCKKCYTIKSKFN